MLAPQTTQEPQQERQFDPAVLLALIPLARTKWGQYAPRRVANKPGEEYLIRVNQGLRDEVRRITESYRIGDISRAEWQVLIEQFINITFVIATAAGVESWDLTQNDFRIASDKWREQFGYYDNFLAEEESGEQKKNGTLLVRAGMYMLAGWGIYWAIKDVSARLFGYGQERRVLGAADHCPDCIDYAAQGWVPIGTLPEPGAESVCLTNCHCRKEYR